MVAGVRLVGAQRAQTALVCGGGVGLGAREAEAVRFCCCRVDEARAELVLRTRRAGGAYAAVEVFVADHEETLDAATRALTVGEEKEEEEGEEGDSDQGEEKRRGKREIAEKENNTVHTHKFMYL